MREIRVELYDDKTIKVKNNNIIADKFDNSITNVIFDFTNSEFANNLKYKYFYYKNTKSENYKIIDISTENTFILDIEFTKSYGDYDCLLVLSDEEVENVFDNDGETFVSNNFILNIRNNFLEDIKNLEIKENKEGL